LEKLNMFLIALYDYGETWQEGADASEIEASSQLSMRDIVDAGDEAVARGLAIDVSSHDHALAWVLTPKGKLYVEALREK